MAKNKNLIKNQCKAKIRSILINSGMNPNEALSCLQKLSLELQGVVNDFNLELSKSNNKNLYV